MLTHTLAAPELVACTATPKLFAVRLRQRGHGIIPRLDFESAGQERLHSFARFCCSHTVVANRCAPFDTGIAPCAGLVGLEVDDFPSGTLLPAALACSHRIGEGNNWTYKGV